MYNNEDPFYEIWNQKSVLADCLRSLGYKKLADQVHKSSPVGNIIDDYAKLTKALAEYSKDTEILDRLCFSGLIYG